MGGYTQRVRDRTLSLSVTGTLPDAALLRRRYHAPHLIPGKPPAASERAFRLSCRKSDRHRHSLPSGNRGKCQPHRVCRRPCPQALVAEARRRFSLHVADPLKSENVLRKRPQRIGYGHAALIEIRKRSISALSVSDWRASWLAALNTCSAATPVS